MICKGPCKVESRLRNRRGNSWLIYINCKKENLIAINQANYVHLQTVLMPSQSLGIVCHDLSILHLWLTQLLDLQLESKLQIMLVPPLILAQCLHVFLLNQIVGYSKVQVRNRFSLGIKLCIWDWKPPQKETYPATRRWKCVRCLHSVTLTTNRKWEISTR